MDKPNILRAIESGDFDLFLQILDDGAKAATREASAASHALGLEVADGRASEDRRRNPIKTRERSPKKY